MKNKSNPFLLATVLAVSAVITTASAAPLYWKTSTAAAWDSASWATAPGGTYDQAWVTGSDVVFEDNGGTALTIKGPAATIYFASITANENVTVTAASTLGTGTTGGALAIVDVASGKTLDFSTQSISTAAGTGFIKNGLGTWALAGNTYPGGFTLNAGTVAVGGVNALGSGGTLTLNGGTLRATSGTARDLSNKYTGGINIGGDVTLGDTTATGALTFSNITALGATTRTLTVNSAATHTGTISGGTGAGLTKAGPGTLTLGGANTYTGPTTISNGILAITSTSALPGFSTNGRYSVASGATLSVTNAITNTDIAAILGTANFAAGALLGFDTSAAARTYSVVLANTSNGALGLVKLGTNTLTLDQANSYSGGTLVDGGGGILAVSHASALGTGAVQVNGSAAGQGNLSVAASLTVNRPLTLKRGTASRAYLLLGNGSTWSGDITVDNTNAVNNNFAAILATGTTLANAGTVSGNIGYSVLGGVASATSQTLVLRNTGGYGRVTGSVSLSNGYVQLLDSSNWEFSNASNTWGTLDINHNSAIVTVGTANTLSSTGIVTSFNASTGGTLRLNNLAGDTAYDQTIAGLSSNVKVGLATGAATLTLNTTADQACSGVISGAISLVKSGSAKQTLTGANTYTGSTTINGGTLALGTTGALSAGDLTISSATLDLRKGTSVRAQTVNNLTLSNATLEIGLNTSPDSITANGTTTVSGSNTLKLNGTIPVGNYNLIATQAPLSGTFVLDTTNVVTSGFPTSYSAAIDGTNYVLTVSGAATPFTAYWRGDVSAVWNDASVAPNSNWATDSTGITDAGQIPGAITDVFFSAGTAANTATTLGTDLSINSLNFESGTATVGGANTLAILATSGNGINVLSGANATLNPNSILCTATAAVQAGGILTVNGGGLGSGPLLVDGTLNLNMNATHSALGGAATGIIARSIAGTGTLTVSGATNSAFAGAINDGTGVMTLAKGGTNTLTLSGTSNYSGGTTLSGGIIQTNSGTALGTGAVAITSTANKIYLGTGVTIASSITITSTGSTDYQGFITANGGDTATVTGTVTVSSGPSTGGHFASFGAGSVLRLMGPVNITGTTSPLSRVGTVEVGGGGNYTEFRIGEGTLRLAAENGLNTAAVLNIGISATSTFDLAGFNQTLAGINRYTTNTAIIGNSSTTADSTLTTTATATFAGIIRDTLGSGTRKTALTINGGVLTLSGVNSYTGNTTVNNGAAITLADNAELRFAITATNGVSNSLSGAGSATIDGDFNIDTTLADASALTTGSWTVENLAAVYHLTTFRVISGATAWTATGDVWTKSSGGKNYSFDEGTGILTMTSSGYDSWATSKGLTGPDAAFDADPDNDGLDNGLEFVLGGEPNPANPGSNSADLLPKVTQIAGEMTFTFKRKDLSESGVALAFQWSTDLTFPTPANDIPVGAVDSVTDTVNVDVTEDIPDADTDTIVITVPAAKAAGGRLFGRLRAVKLP